MVQYVVGNRKSGQFFEKLTVCDRVRILFPSIHGKLTRKDAFVNPLTMICRRFRHKYLQQNIKGIIIFNNLDESYLAMPFSPLHRL